ncbi:MAG: DMT family transporter [Rhodospirillales bacterium]|nr:DMT family transporter [Rhodospirillales bacterium]MBO6785745.1 DMT family transporter [Rhodospirillales bacterium]
MRKNPLAHPADPTPNTGGARDTDSPGKAILCALAGGAVLTLNDGLVKSLAAEFPTGQVLAIRGMFIYFMIILFAIRMGGIHTAWQIRSWKGQTLRGFCVVGSSFCFVTGLSYLPLADAIAIAFAGPLFVTMLAPLMLGETVGWRRWAAVLVGFVGVLVIVRPGTTAFQWFAVFPLMASFLGGMRDLITRKVAAHETTVAVLFVTTTAVMTAGFSTWFFTDWVAVEWRHMKYFVGSGLLVGTAHYLLIEAFRLGEAALVSPFKYGNVLWAVLFGYLLFGDLPDAATLLGAVVVSLSGLYILHRERIRARDARKSRS